jgi:hypothetical protein
MDLTGNKIKNTYGGVLNIGPSGMTDSNLYQVTDGFGTPIPMEVGINEINFTGTFSIGGVAFDLSSGYNLLAINDVNQANAGATAANIFKFSTTLVNNDIEIVGSTKITFPHTGIYNVFATCQVEKSAPGESVVNFWFRRNGADIVGSAAKTTITTTTKQELVNFEFIVNVNHNDYVEICWQSSDTGVALAAVAAQSGPPPIPLMPSCVVVVSQVANIFTGQTDAFINMGLSKSTHSFNLGSKNFDIVGLPNPNYLLAPIPLTTPYFIVGQFVRVQSNIDSDYMIGQVNGWTSSILTVNVTEVSGSGVTFNWTISGIGERGFQGVAGSQGNQGTQGFQGVAGSQGNQGFQGSVGSQGNQGNQGNQGFQGSVGSQGNQGNQGNQGFQGSVGSQGNQGFQGSVGSQGNQGFQGLRGATGSQGFQGFQGNQGFQGLRGATGSQGFQGFQGNQGFQGIIGPQGPLTVTVLTATGSFSFSTGVGVSGAQKSNDKNISIPGSVVGNPVILSVPTEIQTANCCFTAFVKSPGTVSIRFNNYSTSGITTATASFTVMVLQ